MVIKVYDGSTTSRLTFEASGSSGNILQVSNITGFSEYRDGDNLVLLASNGTDNLTVIGAYSDGSRLDFIEYYGANGELIAKRLVSSNETVPSSGLHFFAGTSQDDVIDGSRAASISATGYIGHDEITGSDGSDYIDGGAGNDTLNGGAGDDIIYGGDGDDTINDGRGDDFIDAGEGIDTYFRDMDVTNPDEKWILHVDLVREGLFSPDFGDGNLRGDVLKNFENVDIDGSLDTIITGDDFDNVLSADQGNDELYGGSGNDKLYGGNNNDKLYGGNGNDKSYGQAGNDSLYMDAGNDTLDGGTGTDWLYVTGSTNSVVNLAKTTGQNTGYGTDIIKNIENASGGSGVDKFYGTGSVNILKGNNGNDVLSGKNGNDKLYGGNNNDKLYGGSGNDLLKGDAGRDTLQGDAGKDRMFGGSGADKFVFRITSDSNASASKADVIKDFTQGQDKIDLHFIDASTKISGNNAFTFDGTTSFGTSNQGDIYFKQFNNAGTAKDYTMVYIDTDSDRGTEMSIKLMGLYELTANDFIL
jgi:Ca2+-binding RTX toxin-like protein